MIWDSFNGINYVFSFSLDMIYINETNDRLLINENYAFVLVMFRRKKRNVLLYLNYGSFFIVIFINCKSFPCVSELHLL